MKVKITKLKKDIDKHLVNLESKYPLSRTISEAISGLFAIKADNNLISPWYNSLFVYIQNIRKQK